ncbi:MAG TPA: hypothetical protein VGF98_02900 [Candidatus Tumulicola sp.]|jgi:hypothetical protein
MAYAFGSSAAVAMLFGCAASQPAVGALRAPQQTSAIAAHANGTSWVLPEAKSEDLLYADGGSTYAGDVLMYTFPRGKLVGMLSGLTEPAGMCTDRNGDVWITKFVSGGTVTEYAHGGTQPIATLDTAKTLTPQDCSIDAASGNLAVVGYGPEKPNVRGRILVYSGASGTPKTYKVSFGETSFCGYDNQGNLFIDGFGYNERPPFVAAALQTGASTFKQISFRSGQPSQYPTPVQWDGRYVAIGGPVNIVRYTIENGIAVEEGSTNLNDVFELADAWIEGGKIVATDAPNSPPIQIYRYPAGGDPIEGIDAYGFGVTVSAAK